MSGSKSEIAGNYALSGGTGDPGFVAEQLADVQAERRERRAEAAGHEDARRAIETADAGEPDLGTLTVQTTERHADGTESLVTHEITLERPIDEELGVGHTARLQSAGSHDEDKEAASFVAFIDALAEVTEDGYDWAFWNGLTERELGSAFQQANQQSRGGGQAGE
jgi:hypothetical protein